MKFKRTINFLIACLLAVPLTSCIYDKWGDDIADNVISKFTDEFDTDKNTPTPTGASGVNEQILYETILIEDFLRENIEAEHLIKESIIKEIVNDEFLIQEGVIVESVSVEIYNDIEEIDDDFLCESYHTIDLDYSLIRQRISKGASLVLSQIVIDAVSCVIDICTFNWGRLAFDAGQIIVTAGGTSLSAFIAAQVAKAKSLEAGNSYEMAMYDSLYEGSKAFYFTSVVISTVNTIISIFQLIDSAVKIVKSLVNWVKNSIVGIKIVDEAGKTIGRMKIKGDKLIAVIEVDGTEKVLRQAMGTSLDGTTIIDLYDDAQKYTMSVVRNGDVFGQVIKTMPTEILYKSGKNVGKAKFIIQGNRAFKATYTQAGKQVLTDLGSIDLGGFVKNNYGQIIKKIDLVTGKEFAGFTKIARTKAANKLTVNVFGEVVEITDIAKQTMVPLSKRTYKGAVTYFDSTNAGIFFEKLGSDGITYLKKVSEVASDNGKVSGIIVDGVYDIGWKATLDFVRSDATRNIRTNLVTYVTDNNINLVRQNFPELTLEMIDYIKKYQRIPTSIQIHHIKNVANFPDLAGDLSNLVVVNRETHLLLHGGNFHNMSMTKPSFYIDLKWLFGL